MGGLCAPRNFPRFLWIVMKAWKQRVYKKHHQEPKQAAEDLARELNLTVRCLKYPDPQYQKDSIRRLAQRIDPAVRSIFFSGKEVTQSRPGPRPPSSPGPR